MRERTLANLVLRLVMIASFALILTGPNTTYAQGTPPPVPHAFYGAVQINGQPAPAGTRVEARGVGVLTGIENNPLVVTTPGVYGGPTFGTSKLVVQGDVQDGEPLVFYINGFRAEVAEPDGAWQGSYPFTSGVITELNLRATIYSLYLPGVRR